jgi:hypothetical protein
MPSPPFKLSIQAFSQLRAANIIASSVNDFLSGGIELVTQITLSDLFLHFSLLMT